MSAFSMISESICVLSTNCSVTGILWPISPLLHPSSHMCQLRHIYCIFMTAVMSMYKKNTSSFIELIKYNTDSMVGLTTDTTLELSEDLDQFPLVFISKHSGGESKSLWVTGSQHTRLGGGSQWRLGAWNGPVYLFKEMGCCLAMLFI